MPGRKLELIQRVLAAHHLPLPMAAVVIEAFQDTLIESLASEGRFELRDFGVFRVIEFNPRLGRNPKTGTPVNRPRRRRVAFKVGRVMKQRIRGK